MKKEDIIKKGFSWKLLSGTACALVFLAVLAVSVFSGGSVEKEDSTGISGPEEVLSGFYSALVAGDEDAVMMYCDTAAAVMDYVGGYMHAAEELIEEEPGALSVVSGMVKTEVTGKKKSKATLEMEFMLYLEGDGDGRSQARNRKAEMRQENGKWLIVDISGK